MKPEKIEYFQNLLEFQKQALLAAKDAAGDSARPVTLDQASVGRLSRMDAMQGQAMAVEMQRRREIGLQRIEAALLRIKTGEYGLCTVCEEEIADRRLEIDPSVTLCIECAARRERS